MVEVEKKNDALRGRVRGGGVVVEVWFRRGMRETGRGRRRKGVEGIEGMRLVLLRRIIAEVGGSWLLLI